MGWWLSQRERKERKEVSVFKETETSGTGFKPHVTSTRPQEEGALGPIERKGEKKKRGREGLVPLDCRLEKEPCAALNTDSCRGEGIPFRVFNRGKKGGRVLSSISEPTQVRRKK